MTMYALTRISYTKSITACGKFINAALDSACDVGRMMNAATASLFLVSLVFISLARRFTTIRYEICGFRFSSLGVFLCMISMPVTLLTAQQSISSSPTPASDNVPTNLSSTTSIASPVNEVLTNNEKSDTNATAETSASVEPVDPSVMPPSDPSSNTDTNEPLPNDPNALPSTSPEEAIVPINSTESIEKKKEQIKVRYYEVRTQVEKEEAVTSLRLKADKAASDEEKRQALRAYYDLLFERMRKVDPSLNDRCDIMQAAYLRHLEQVCIEPSIPLNPRPVVNDVAAPSATPSPTPSGKKKLNKKKLITTTKSQS